VLSAKRAKIMKNVFTVEDLKKAFEAGQEQVISDDRFENDYEHKYYSFENWFDEWIKES
jgi:hypothetical protein